MKELEELFNRFSKILEEKKERKRKETKLDKEITLMIYGFSVENRFPHLFLEQRTAYIDKLKNLRSASSIEKKQKEYDTIVNETAMRIGEQFRHGTIFYLDNTGHNGLMFIRSDIELSYRKALEYCKELRYDNFRNWRLPTIEEAQILCKLKYMSYNYRDTWYWTSTPVNDKNMWGTYRFANVFSYDGAISAKPTADYFKIILVRSF